MILIRAMRGNNDNTELSGGRLFAPSMKSLLAPAVMLVTIYLCALIGLWLAGQIESPVALLCIVTLAVTPFLIAYAVLRRVTTRLAVLPHAVHVEPGFPRGDSLEIPYDLIRSLSVRRGLGGHLAGSGTLRIGMSNGSSVAICDLPDPEAAANSIRAQQVDRDDVQIWTSDRGFRRDRLVSAG